MNYEKAEYIKGTCTSMCPVDEIIIREAEGLLHVLELQPKSGKNGKPQADTIRMVKSFLRSSVGQEKPAAKNLRTPECLLETVNYLLKIVISNEKLPFYKIYDFIADRLQAVRQDMIIQNLPKPYFISILQPLVRFYAYSAYRLCEEDISIFDPALNNKQIQECLKKLLVCYDYYDMLEKKNFMITGTFAMNYNLYRNERPYFEALYILFNLGNSEAITRGFNLSSQWRLKIVQLSINISLSFMKRNFVRVCRLITQLPNLLLAVTSLHLPLIRRTYLNIMNTAYSSKHLRYPTSVLYQILIYDSKMDLINDCRFYKMDCDEKSICFLKGTINKSIKIVQPKKMKFIDEELCKKSIVSLVLFGDLD